MYPALVTDLGKLKHNTKFLRDKCLAQDIEIMTVTKVFCGNKTLAQAMVDAGVTMLADSRVSNLENLKDIKAEKVLLRLPMISEAAKVVEFVDISLNSELATLKALSQAAGAQGKKHRVILMVDLGDLREGVLPENLMNLFDETLKLSGIEVVGLGVNLTCYGGVMPDANNLGQLVALAKEAEAKFGISLKYISGGNSSSLYLLDKGEMPKEVNLLRLGEAVVLGRETAFGDVIEGTHTDVFTLEVEIIELKEKDSLPKGTIGMDAFGNHPTFEDKGRMLRAILAIGKQDVNPSALIPLDENIEIIGASSDHLLMDFTKAAGKYQVGDTVKFNVEYGALLNLWTSAYIHKEYK